VSRHRDIRQVAEERGAVFSDDGSTWVWSFANARKRCLLLPWRAAHLFFISQVLLGGRKNLISSTGIKCELIPQLRSRQLRTGQWWLNSISMRKGSIVLCQFTFLFINMLAHTVRQLADSDLVWIHCKRQVQVGWWELQNSTQNSEMTWR